MEKDAGNLPQKNESVESVETKPTEAVVIQTTGELIVKDEKNKVGRPKNIPTPELMEQHFEDYKTETKSKPLLIKDWVGKDAYCVQREKERPLTMEGFEVYCYKQHIINDLSQYFANLDERYSAFIDICRAIKKEIRLDQIEGGMAGIYSTSITQRINNLVEKTETELKFKKLGKDLADEKYD